jgi:hypothetical protein
MVERAPAHRPANSWPGNHRGWPPISSVVVWVGGGLVFVVLVQLVGLPLAVDTGRR